MDSEVAERINNIKNDRLHGASWLSREAIGAMNLAIEKSEASTVADFLEELNSVASKLMESRPSMASIANCVSCLVHQVIRKSEGEKDVHLLKEFAYSKGEEIIRYSKEAALKAAELGSEMIENSDRLITCSYSSTLCKAFEAAKRQGKRFQVIVAESKFGNRAYGEITARELGQHGISVKLIPDEIEPYIIETSKALVGADSILNDGSLINGAPTYRLALAASGAKIPFYSVCESSKFNFLDYQEKLEEGFEIIPPSLINMKR